jgi:hypothetical protein
MNNASVCEQVYFGLSEMQLAHEFQSRLVPLSSPSCIVTPREDIRSHV